MGQNNLPDADPAFNDWFAQFSAYIGTNAAALGLTSPQTTPITAALAAWNTAFPAHQSAQSNASAMTVNKNKARANAEAVLRPLIKQLQASQTVTDAQRQAMQIGVHATTRTPAAIPTTAPMATIDTSQRLQHSIAFQDSVAATTKAKPAGVSGCEIWEKIGAPAPTDVSQMSYLATATRTPFVAQFTGGQGGQTVCYWLRWVNTHGDKGPWSQPISATIAA